MTAVPDIWDPPKVVGKLAHDGTIEAYEEFPDCKIADHL